MTATILTKAILNLVIEFEDLGDEFINVTEDILIVQKIIE